MLNGVEAGGFLSDTTPAKDLEVWPDIMTTLADYAQQARSTAQIRTAGETSSKVISDSGCGAWLVAIFGEPAVIVVRGDLSPGLPTWHAARLLVALGGSPTALAPGEAGVIYSRDKPLTGWTSPDEKNLDRLAAKTLRSMGVPRWLVRRVSR